MAGVQEDRIASGGLLGQSGSKGTFGTPKNLVNTKLAPIQQKRDSGGEYHNKSMTLDPTNKQGLKRHQSLINGGKNDFHPNPQLSNSSTMNLIVKGQAQGTGGISGRSIADNMDRLNSSGGQKCLKLSGARNRSLPRVDLQKK